MNAQSHYLNHYVPLQVSDIAVTAKTTQKLRISHGPTTTATSTATSLLDTGAEVNLICSSMIRNEWRDGMERKKLPALRTATKQPQPLDGLISLHPHPGDLNTQIQFGATPTLPVDILLGTCFKDQFIRVIVLTKQKTVPWVSQPVAILSRKAKRRDSPTLQNSETESSTHSQQLAEDVKHGLVPVVCQIVMKPFVQHPMGVKKHQTSFSR